jgi:hypothetical protein
MSGSSETFESLGWTHHEVARHMDALPLLDEPITMDPTARSLQHMHWISAAVAVGLFALARLDLLPAMPW